MKGKDNMYKNKQKQYLLHLVGVISWCFAMILLPNHIRIKVKTLMKDLLFSMEWTSFLAWNCSDPRLGGAPGAIYVLTCSSLQTEALQRSPSQGCPITARGLVSFRTQTSAHLQSSLCLEALTSRSDTSLLLRRAIHSWDEQFRVLFFFSLTGVIPPQQTSTHFFPRLSICHDPSEAILSTI